MPFYLRIYTKNSQGKNKIHKLKFFLFFLSALFYLLAALDMARIEVPEINALRGFSDSIVMLSIFLLTLYFFKKNKITSRWHFFIIFLVSILARIMNATGEGVVLRGENVQYVLLTFEIAFLSIMLITGQDENLIIAGLHPLMVIYSGGEGSIFSLSLLLYLLIKELDINEIKPVFIRRLIKGLSGFFTLPLALIVVQEFLKEIKEKTKELKKISKEYVLFLTVILLGIISYLVFEIQFPLVKDTVQFFKGSACNALLYRFIEPSIFPYSRFIGGIVIFSALYSGSIADIIVLYLITVPSTVKGPMIFSIAGFKEESKALKVLSITFLIQILYLEFGNSCSPLLLYFILQFAPFLIVYLMEHKNFVQPSPEKSRGS